MNPIETSVFLFSPKQNSLETVVILQGLIYFAILPSLLLTVSLIICGNSGSQRKPISETRNGKKDRTISSSQSRKVGGKKSYTKTKSTETTESAKTRKVAKLSGSKLKTKKSRKSSKQIESSLSTKTVERMSSGQKRSSRLERFQKLPSAYINGPITYNIGEKPKQELKMEPNLLNWNILGGIQKVYLTNLSDERKAIKIKCSDNHLYRVTHSSTFIEPGEVCGIDVVRQNGGAKPDKMVFLWTKAEKSDENASKLFNKLLSYPMLTLPLTVNNPTA